jgi:UDP-glucose 4-epimerase
VIVVTGGSGFIGSHLCARLHEEGKTVRIIDIAPPPLGTPGEFVRTSVLDAGRLLRLFSGAEAIVHLAALVDVTASVADPYSDFEVNATGTVTVLESARRAGVKKVAFASSAAVYGNTVEVPVDETHPTLPLSPYGASKLAAERHVLLYNSLYGMQNTALRLFNVYGRGQSPLSPYSGVITKFSNCITERKQPLIFGDGEQTRDFVHVDDVCEAFCRAIESQGCSSPINIASGKEISVLDLLKKMYALAGRMPNPKYFSERKGEIRRSVASIALAERHLGYSPKIPINQGLAELVRN